jgi:transposase InsO family protein
MIKLTSQTRDRHISQRKCDLHGISNARCRDKPIAPASPWQNSFAERLIGSIRRECLDHIIVLDEEHLRRILKTYADYYNGVRTHRLLNKDAPVSRQVQRSGVINSRAIPGGLHRQYVRI